MPSKHKKKSARIQTSAAAAPTRTVASLRPHQNGLLRLPDDVLAAILELLGWAQRLAMANTCRRLWNLVNGGPWMQCARFTPQDTPAVFTALMVRPRNDVIVELDLSFYVTAKSERLVKAIAQCTNLVVLRCVHSRILSTAMVRLLKNKLRKLECLHWTVDTADVEVPVFPARESEGSLRCDCSVMPPNLKTMYVEVVRSSTNVDFVCSVLRHCHALKSLHCHERESADELYDIEYRIFSSYRDASGRRFKDFTYTTESSRSGDALLMRLKDARAANVNFFSALGTSQFFSTGRGGDAITHMKNIWLGRKFRNLTSLTLMALPESAAMFVRNIRNQSCLSNFVRSCVALVELNLSAFHFSPDFNWSSMLATGGLDHIRSLALAACALCHPAHLRLLGRASFKLRELDVRSFPQDVNECKFCLRATTCDDEALAPLRCLDHLERLTLCEMPHARSLRFLYGCASMRELRLCNVPIWSGKGDRDMAPVASLWPQLRAFKLESVMSVRDFRAFHRMPAAPTMKHLCLGAHFSDWGTRIDMDEEAGLVLEACPAVDVLHLHFYLSAKGDQHGFFPRRQFLEACDAPDVDDAAWLSTADRVWLCYCSNYIGLIAPNGVK
ncbi:hypothetical protein MTO96_033185 [Rhipicephalus appendiculatus]